MAEIAAGPDTRICERCGSSFEAAGGPPSACPFCERSALPDDYGLRDTRLPIKIEFIESAAKAEELLPKLLEMIGEGVVEVQDTTVLKSVTARLPY